MIIDEDCLMRGAAHRFLLIKTKSVRKITGASSESGLFYVYVSRLGELIFALIAFREANGFRKLRDYQFFSIHDMDNCRCEIVNPSILPDELRSVQKELESCNVVSDERLLLRQMSGLDPYRLRVEKDILRVYDLHENRYILVLAESMKDDYIIARRVIKNRDKIVETDEEAALIVIRHRFSLEIYAE